MIETILLAVSAVYLIEYVAVWIGQRRSRHLERTRPASYPIVTALVAARNETDNIERCLRALLAQDYPAGRLQIVAVNDDSQDDTLAIMERLAAEHPGRIVVISTFDEPGHARGKARAIAQGIDASQGEIILLTDADCAPPPTWARAVTEYFVAGADVYGGFTIIEARNLFGMAQQLDWIHLQSLGSSAITLGFPVGVLGNNFAFRRTAYEAVGGYRGVPFTVTEDFALYTAMVRNGSRAVFPCDHEARMYTLPCPTLGDMLRQKQRWARGGTENTVPGYTLFLVALFMMIAFSVAPFVSWRAFAVVWGVKFVCDFLVIGASYARLRMARLLWYFPIFEFYFIVQLALIPVLLMSRTVVWKGREYR